MNSTVLSSLTTVSQTSYTVLLLRVASISVLAGRAWQHLFWDAPVRALFWDETLMQEAVELTMGLSWQAYTTHPYTDLFITILTRSVGIVYLLCALAAAVATRRRRWTSYFLLFGSTCLFGLALLYWKEQFFRGGQLIEYTAQFGSPLLLYGVLFRSLRTEQLLKGVKIAVALTFLGHGLYAIGFYPVPGHFLEMVIRIFGMTEGNARLFLQVAGLLDIILAVGIFLPYGGQWCLLYATAWGFATALARPWSAFHPAMPWATLHQSIFEAVYRLPHAILPLLGWWLVTKVKGLKFGESMTHFKEKATRRLLTHTRLF